jgi:hypothetical protein
MTQQDVETWDENPELFVLEEGGDSYKYNLRVSKNATNFFETKTKNNTYRITTKSARNSVNGAKIHHNATPS